ncbi:MAG: alpha-L-fucosidase [Puniceicoccaceae bacterium]
MQLNLKTTHNSLVAGILLAASWLSAAPETPPNIILIVADDLGAHTLGIDGNPVLETPQLDQLALSGTRFAQGYAPAPVCKPSRGAIMTGQYPPRTAVYRVAERHKGYGDKIRHVLPDNAPLLPLESITIAEVLADAGYRTAHFGKWHLQAGPRGLPGEQGFDTFLESHGAHFNAHTAPPTDLPEGSYIGDVMTDRALAFVNEAVSESKPFFLYLPYFLIHKPWEAKEEHLRHFRDKLGPDADETLVTVAAMTLSLDENVGRVMDYLKESDLAANTLVVFTSDNGGYKMDGNILNAPLRGCKGEMYEGGLRVPFIFSWPNRIPSGSILNDPIHGVDLFPTLAAFAGAESPTGHSVDGVDLKDLITGRVEQLAPRPLFWFFPKYAGWNKKSELWRDEWRNVILDGGYKLIEYRETGRVELFNLQEDPFETKELSDAEPEKAKELQQKLANWKQSVGAPPEVPNPGYTGPLEVDELMAYEVDASVELPTASRAAHEAWKDQRFGMFIHWGPISQMGKQLSHSRKSPSHRTGGRPYKTAPIPPEVYDVQYKTFNPVNFDPDAMMKMARAAGVEYVVFTAKHHAGFSMFDSAVTEYDILSTPYGKDITRELADAARNNGIDFGFYYSPRDWYHPDCDSESHHQRYIEQFYKPQMTELLENYGPIHSIFFDGLGPGDWGDTSAEVMKMIRDRHPDAMVNDRGGAGADYYTPEHYISYFNNDVSWEACHTTTGQWGYNPDVGAKSLPDLMEILLYTWGGDGNILLNIGPMGDGSVNPVEQERFGQLADWWRVHGEVSIRGTRGGPYIPGPWGVSTRKDNQIFLHIFRWGEGGTLSFPAFEGMKLKTARRLDGGPVSASESNGHYQVQIDPKSRNDIVTTVELSFDKPVSGLEPLQRIQSLTISAVLDSSHNRKELPFLRDQDVHTEWYAYLQPEDNKELWLEARFKEPVTIGAFSGARGEHWAPQHRADLQVLNESGDWETVSGKFNRFRFTTMNCLPQPVTTDRVRLRIQRIRSYSNPQHFVLAEWELFPPIEN